MMFLTKLVAFVGAISVVSATSLRASEDTTLIHRDLKSMEYQAAMSGPPLQCFLENGFDYVGNDIANVPATEPGRCCWECYRQQGCKAFSWSNFNGGTCWLKSARGQIVVNPNVKSALMLVGVQYRVCELMENTDFVDNDIGKARAANAGLCCDICHNTPACRAYAWTNQDGGTCWLKSKGGQPVYKAGVKAAEAYPTEPSACYFERDVDFEGFDVGNGASASHTGCCKMCENTRLCRAYTWTNHNGGWCWLKSIGGNRVTKTGAISGTWKPNPGQNATMEYDTDYVGNDIGYARARYGYLCASVCHDFTGCRAFSWSDYNGGSCWIKSGKNESIAKTGVQSGVLYP
jgi:hypothetical protein